MDGEVLSLLNIRGGSRHTACLADGYQSQCGLERLTKCFWRRCAGRPDTAALILSGALANFAQYVNQRSIATFIDTQPNAIVALCCPVH
jgi:hypothetical protein